MTPTQKEINNFYKSKNEYEAKLDEAMKNVPKIEELYRLINDLIVSTTTLRETAEAQSKSIDKLSAGYESNKDKIICLDKEIALIKQSEKMESKKMTLPTTILIAIVCSLLATIITMLVEHFSKFL